MIPFHHRGVFHFGLRIWDFGFEETIRAEGEGLEPSLAVKPCALAVRPGEPYPAPFQKFGIGGACRFFQSEIRNPKSEIERVAGPGIEPGSPAYETRRSTRPPARLVTVGVEPTTIGF